MFCLNFWYFIYSMIDGLDNWRQYSCDQLNFIVYWDLIFLFGPLSDTVFSIDLLLNFFFQGWVDIVQISLVTSLTERSHHYLIRLSSSLTVRRWSSLSCNSSDLFWYSNSWIGSFKFQFNFSSSGIRLTSQWSGKKQLRIWLLFGQHSDSAVHVFYPILSSFYRKSMSVSIV